MIERNNKTCICCNKSYKYCSGCAEYAHLEPWHSIYCSDNCKEIFNAVSMYQKVSTEETKKRLDKCDLSNKDNFHKNILKVVNELYSPTELIEEIKPMEIEINIENTENIENADSVNNIEDTKELETLEITNDNCVENITSVNEETTIDLLEENPIVKTVNKYRKKKKDYEVI